MAKQLSKASLIVRVLLILVLVVLIGTLVMEHRAAGAADTAFTRAKEVVAQRKNSADLQGILGRKPDYDATEGIVREQWYTYKGIIRDYTVVVLFNILDNGEVGEETNLNIYNKLKGKREENQDEGLK